LLLRTPGQWAAIAVCAAFGVGLFAFVDLTPRVESDFFFSTDDPQIESSLRIRELFGELPQIYVVARGEPLESRRYVERVLALTEDLVEIAGIRDVRSLSRGPGGLEETLEQLDEDDVDEILEDVAESPLWSELIMAPDGSATFLVIQLAEDADLAATIRAIDTTLEGHADIDFELGASGVPYVAEHVRTRLTDELRRFTIVAFVAFAVLVALLFRS
jgi:predicted RND superfamily exporter protein